MSDEFLEHTEDAGDQAVTRTEDLLHQLAETVSHMASHLSNLTDHVAHLEGQKAIEEVPATAREVVNDGIDTAGAAGGVVTKAVDVPLAIAEDTVHDSAETGKEVAAATEETAAAAKRKLFKKRRK